MTSLTLGDLNNPKPIRTSFNLNQLHKNRLDANAIPEQNINFRQNIKPLLKMNSQKFFGDFKDSSTSFDKLMNKKQPCTNCSNQDNKYGALKFLKK